MKSPDDVSSLSDSESRRRAKCREQLVPGSRGPTVPREHDITGLGATKLLVRLNLLGIDSWSAARPPLRIGANRLDPCRGESRHCLRAVCVRRFSSRSGTNPVWARIARRRSQSNSKDRYARIRLRRGRSSRSRNERPSAVLNSACNRRPNRKKKSKAIGMFTATKATKAKCPTN